MYKFCCFFKNARFVYKSFQVELFWLFLSTIWSNPNLFVRIKPPNPNLQVRKSGFPRIILAYWNKDSLRFVGICWICENKSDLLKEAIKLTMLTFLNFLKMCLWSQNLTLTFSNRLSILLSVKSCFDFQEFLFCCCCWKLV